MLESEFNNSDSVRLGVVNKEKQALVGYCFSRVVQDEFSLLNIGIVPAFRRRGLGRILMGNMLLRAGELGCRHAFLEVRQSNTVAQSLYGAFGFKVCGQRKGYYADNGETALVMELSFF